MSDEVVFIDTNVLVYAYDRTAGEKHRKARALVLGLRGEQPLPVVSVQVLQELYVNLLRKGLSDVDASEILELHLAWKVVTNDPDLLLAGVRARERWQLSPWDAWIVAAAQRGGADVIWTEDLNNGQDYGGVRAVNPFQ
jgi:predicted nucleic acid-binding protein